DDHAEHELRAARRAGVDGLGPRYARPGLGALLGIRRGPAGRWPRLPRREAGSGGARPGAALPAGLGDLIRDRPYWRIIRRAGPAPRAPPKESGGSRMTG